jgi:hypothetical protein
MSKKFRGPTTSIVTGKVPAPVRVKLKRVNCDQAIPYPPDGQAREWWQRLMTAFGTTSSAFVQASLHQLIAAARLPNSGISEIAVNASLALIEGAKPQGEVQGALVLQMACTHAAAMAVLGRLGGGHGRTISAVSRLLRAYPPKSKHCGAFGATAPSSLGSSMSTSTKVAKPSLAMSSPLQARPMKGAEIPRNTRSSVNAMMR